MNALSVTVLSRHSVLWPICLRSARSVRSASARHLISISSQPEKTSRLGTLDPSPDDRSNGLTPHEGHHYSGSDALPGPEGHAQYAKKAVKSLQVILTVWAGNWVILLVVRLFRIHGKSVALYRNGNGNGEATLA